jgi:hypothetical protein
MNYRIILFLLAYALVLATLLPAPGQVYAQSGSDGKMTNPGGETLAPAGVSPIGGSVAAGDVRVASSMFAPAGLANQDYQKVYDQAKTLLDTGVSFRTGALQLPPACRTPEECQLNYQDFNGGALFYGFCSDYDAIDERGFCPGDDPSSWPQSSEQIRAQLVRARTHFGFLALAEPAGVRVQVNGQSTPVRALGRAGVLTATREIANIHLIFGNEFLVDALDYRFSGNDPRADQIINEEINQLKQAQQQFELAVGVLAHAFNADFGGPNGGFIGDYFSAREFDLFGIASERMVATIAELADRYRQLGQDGRALSLYGEAFANQYVQAMALATSAAKQNADFAENGGWEIMTNLERLRARAQAIHDGINPFGFVDTYVPLQTYDELRTLVRNDFLRDATEDENTAATAQREFDHNRTALNQELQNLRLTYDTRLLEICGPSQDDYVTCDGEGGLMRQNYLNMVAASARLRQVKQQQRNVQKQIEIEQTRAGRVIQLTLKNGDTIAATEMARGLINAVRTTEMTVESSTHDWYAGAEVRETAKFSIKPWEWGLQVDVIGTQGYRYSRSNTSSTTTVWDPDQIELARLNSAQAVQQAVSEAEITGANSAATIRTMALQLSELAIQEQIQLAELNRISAEHNDLVNQYHHWLNLRLQAQANQLDSYLNNPAYRILRDQSTVEAARSIGVAAQFAYLTAKALEYEFLVRFPKLGDIYKARTADDVDNFMNGLEAFRTAIGSPGGRNRYPYRISLAKDMLGLSDENLDPTGALSNTERARQRLDGFQAVLQRNVITDTNTGQVVAIEIPFTTSLVDNKIFSPNIWNNRIAGVALPADVPNTQGVSINLLTRQFGEIGTPEVQLTHSGHAAYRTVNGAIVQYVPENAKLAGYVTPPGFESRSATATILAGVNGNGRGAPTSALFNRSVAASNWSVRIDLRSPFNASLDLSQLEDIELQLDTTGIALANRVQAAEVDAAQLQAEFEE